MTRRYAHLIAVAVLIAAFSASIFAQQETVAEVRAKADRGNAVAQATLGGMYATGIGVPQDDAEAVRWYRLAAEQGDAKAQLLMGIRYDNGQGLPQDYVQAHMWFNLAVSRLTGEDREDSVRLRDLIADQLTPDDLSEAQRLAREWNAAHPREPYLRIEPPANQRHDRYVTVPDRSTRLSVSQNAPPA